MEKLRSPDGCPWDREQDAEKLKTYIIEEAYEVINAIDKRDSQELREELGDLLLQIVFQAQIANEKGEFDIYDVIDTITNKLVQRHPHVFAGLQVNGADEVLRNWEGFKLKEGKAVLIGVPKTLPALLMAYRIQEKVSRVGFDWKNPDEVFAKLEEETNELREAVRKGSPAEIASELGDLLFTIVNISRFLKTDPEDALRMTIEKFTARFNKLEEMAKSQGRELKGMTIQEIDELWEQVKTL